MGQFMNFNLTLFQFINSFVGEYRILDQFGIFLAHYLSFFLILSLFLLIISIKNWHQRIYFFSLSTLSIILSWGIISKSIKFFFPSLRPFEVLEIQSLVSSPLGDAFPSGHMAFFFALAFSIFIVYGRWGWLFLGAASLMGLARIFAGVHWPLDILAGAIIGIISALLIKKLLTFSLKIKNTPLKSS